MSNEEPESEGTQELDSIEIKPETPVVTISKREEYTAYGLLFVIHVLMALFFVISRWGLSSPTDKVNPNVFSTLRLGFACIIVVPIMKIWLKDISIPVKPVFNPTVRHLRAIGIFGGLIPITCFSIGVSLSSAINAAIIAVCQPVLTAAIGIASGVDEFMARKIVGIALSIAGALVMLDLQNFKLDGATLGNVLLLTQQCAISVYNVLNRNLIATSGLHYGVITAWTLIFGSSMVAIATLPVTIHAASWHITLKGWFVTCCVYCIQTTHV
jgi:drug/metabolite transporter (DMT)-like permease